MPPRVTEWLLYRRPRTDVWWARRSNCGKRESKTTGCSSKKDAEAVIRRWRTEAADPAFAASTTVTFEAACERFLAQSRRRVAQGGLAEATLEIHGEKVQALIRGLGARTLLSSVTPARVLEYVERRMDTYVCSIHAKGAKKTAPCAATACGDGVTSHTLSKELAVLRGVLELARHLGQWSGDPAGITPPGWSAGYRPRERWLAPDEWSSFISEFEPHRAAHLCFILAVGARTSEAERARRADVDLDRGVVLVRGSKTVAAHAHVPIVPFARPLLARVLEDAPGKDLLFAPWVSMARDIRTVTHRLGIPHVAPVDLRRTFASWLVQAGLPHELTAKCLRHTSTAMVQMVYGRSTVDATQALIAAHFARTV